MTDSSSDESPQESSDRSRPPELPEGVRIEAEKRHRELEAELRKKKELTGIPPRFCSKDLLYNPPSDTLIAHLFSQDPSDRQMLRVFARPANQAFYKQIGDWPSDITCMEVITSEGSPLLYFTTFRLGDFDALWQATLPHLVVTRIATGEELYLQVQHKRAWISKLISTVPNGKDLFCVVAVQLESGRVHYWLSRLTMETRFITLISELMGVFF
jgi:hypothetical protein